MPTMNMKPVQPDAILGAIIGTAPIQRTAITKALWEYIKTNDRQDATDRRRINADDKLRPFFDGAASVTMFELTKCVSRHVTPVTES
jgi:upstream activation factor subunit UAF30